jgi:hypothetical protein
MIRTLPYWYRFRSWLPARPERPLETEKRELQREEEEINEQDGFFGGPAFLPPLPHSLLYMGSIETVSQIALSLH